MISDSNGTFKSVGGQGFERASQETFLKPPFAHILIWQAPHQALEEQELPLHGLLGTSRPRAQRALPHEKMHPGCWEEGIRTTTNVQNGHIMLGILLVLFELEHLVRKGTTLVEDL